MRHQGISLFTVLLLVTPGYAQALSSEALQKTLANDSTTQWQAGSESILDHVGVVASETPFGLLPEDMAHD